MSWYDPSSSNVNNADNALGATAQQTSANYGRDVGALNSNVQGLQAIANGQNSVSALQLRQSLQQNQAAQQSMAASAAPQNAAMAARTAAIQSGVLGAGLAGQQAVAGLQERNQAQQQLGSLLLGQRGQDLSASNQANGQVLQAGPGQSWYQQYAQPVIGAAAGALTAYATGGASLAVPSGNGNGSNQNGTDSPTGSLMGGNDGTMNYNP